MTDDIDVIDKTEKKTIKAKAKNKSPECATPTDSATTEPSGSFSLKQQSYQFGKSSEWLAMLWLMLKGYNILNHRFKTPLGEIDIIAKKGRTVVFVEVKARRDINQLAHAVSFYQQERIMRAGGLYMAKRPYLHDCRIRFDVITLSPYKMPKHTRGAW